MSKFQVYFGLEAIRNYGLDSPITVEAERYVISDGWFWFRDEEDEATFAVDSTRVLMIKTVPTVEE